MTDNSTAKHEAIAWILEHEDETFQMLGFTASVSLHWDYPEQDKAEAVEWLKRFKKQ